jgi:hypothetical protein
MEADNEKEFKEKMMQSGASDNDFKVPHDYFESLPGRISNRIQVKQKAYKTNWVPRIALGVCSVALIIIGVNRLNQDPSKKASEENIILTEANIEHEEFEEEDLIDTYAVSTTNENSELAEYLIENHIDINEIITD